MQGPEAMKNKASLRNKIKFRMSQVIPGVRRNETRGRGRGCTEKAHLKHTKSWVFPLRAYVDRLSA